MITTVCIVRHGQTNWNKYRLIQGQLNNKLNDTGRMQARQTGEMLLKNDPNWDIVISSPLDRAKESAKIMADILGYQGDIIIDNSVIERNFGTAEGHIIDDYIYDLIKVDQVLGLEKSYDLQNRSKQAILNIVKKYPGKKILITSHSHFIKGFVTTISNEYSWTTWIKNAAANYFIFDDVKLISHEINKTF